MILRSMSMVISKLYHLRHMYLLSVRLGFVKPFQLRLGNLKSSETLVNFDTIYCKLDDLSQFTKLTKLKIRTQKGLGEIKPARNL